VFVAGPLRVVVWHIVAGLSRAVVWHIVAAHIAADIILIEERQSAPQQ
jgi:hypothetical protein